MYNTHINKKKVKIMKKLGLLSILLVMLSFVGCKKTTKVVDTEKDTTAVVVDSVKVDSLK